MHAVKLSRREFLKVGAAAGGGLLIGFHLPLLGRLAEAAEKPLVFAPNAWIRIGADNSVTFMVARSEMGQGVMTSLPMLIAEELEVNLDKVRLEMAPADPAYVNPLLGLQATGGSTSVRSAWEPLRQAGAAARGLLIEAAAKTWGVTPESCRAQNGGVIHAASGRHLSYGRLAAIAATLPVPEEVFLKEPKEFKIIGKPVPRLDSPPKVDGRASFGIDAKVPGMLIASVLRCPVFGGKAASYNAHQAMAVKGVRHVLQISSGLAVVADHFWAALQGRKALEVKWDYGPHAGLSSAVITHMFEQASEHPGTVARSEGDAAAALKRGAKRLEAVYQVPYLAHATMEPMNCTAHVRKDGCDIWAPTQAQGPAQQTAARLTGLPPSAIRIHTTYLGGGFGRRFEQDFLSDAVEISKSIGIPVKVIWTREDDMQHDVYRPATYNRLHAALDKNGLPTAWTHRIAGPSILARVFPDSVKNGIDRTSVDGAANIPYAIPNLHVDYVMVNPGVPVGFWRSVGNSQNAFIVESFLDEIAAAGRHDPYELRRTLLAHAPRHRAVLELAAAKAGWGKPPAHGRYRGIAVHESFASYVAQVAEVSVSKEGAVRVHRVVCAVDCGTVVNPNTVAAQMESAIVYGLTAALKGEITLEHGRVVQSNFDNYPLLRMHEMPDVEVHVMASEAPPGGVGEPGTPPIAPAVANAVFAATGKRVRRLPIRASDLKA
ncbi:MAG: xanthine dehydrogenase family protein molybdopterin-binding subunit [Gammaproteobacteria bacterium]|nr:xanthine dehydrogenase family protein molybdopterin-binding subunit [Gammaproteobacteria bacterium]